MTADDYLRLSVHSRTPTVGGDIAQRGLRLAEAPMDADAHLLLLREIYRSHLYARRVRSAHAIARKMVRLGVMQELAYADLGRACAALGWWRKAALAHRIAARNAPATRRSLHWAHAGSAFQHGGFYEEALGAYERAVRWSLTQRPLHRGQRLVCLLDQGESAADLEELPEVLDMLTEARCGEGYGRYVRGLLHHARGEFAEARLQLATFLKRNGDDPLKSTTLRYELARTRATLRALKGDG